MGTTPAAHLARLRVEFLSWRIERADGGFTARHRDSAEELHASTLTELENLLHEWEQPV